MELTNFKLKNSLLKIKEDHSAANSPRKALPFEELELT